MVIMNKVIVCASCGSEDDWEGFEDIVRVTGKEGDKPEIITIAACVCGYQQEVVVV